MHGYYETKVTDILSGFNKTKNGVTQIERARIIRRTLGVSVAARYMALRGWSVESALHILAGA